VHLPVVQLHHILSYFQQKPNEKKVTKEILEFWQNAFLFIALYMVDQRNTEAIARLEH